MATITFVSDQEEGHLLPTFHLAGQLAARGHHVFYLALADSCELIRRHGFEAFPILESAAPKGSVRGWQQDSWSEAKNGNGAANGARPASGADETAVYERCLQALLHEDILAACPGRKPDLLMMTSLLPVNILVLHYRYRIPTVMLTPWLRTPASTLGRQAEDTLVRLRSGLNEIVALVRKADPSAKRLTDVTAPFWQMRELILCPRDLEIPGLVYEDQPEPRYIEASVDLTRREEGEFPWQRLDPGKRLLYCSMGSQSHMTGKAVVARFLRAALDGVAKRPDWQLVLATGRLLSADELGAIPDNAIVVGWAPQLGLLRRAAAMITHGGLGTVKECIFHEVPMVVYPLMRDQPENGRRIVHHGLGLAGDPTSATADEIAGLVARVDEEPSFRDHLARLHRRFAEIEESGIGVQRIEEVLGALGLSGLPPQAALAGSAAGV